MNPYFHLHEPEVKAPSQGGYEPDYTRSAALKAALAYAERGQRVFPCGANKAPLVASGFKSATTDRSRVHAFWSRWTTARIGLPTGEKFFVVDVDRLEALGELPAELPRTWTVRTPRGAHYYFRPVEGITNSPGGLPKGIDVRGTGGYVIGPPSPGYNVIDRTPIAEAPNWLLKIIRGSRKPDPPRPRRSDAQPTLLDGPPIPEGGRHGAMLSMAGRLHDGARDADHLAADLLAADLLAINNARCTPPLPVSEVNAIAEWAASREACSTGRPVELEKMLDSLSGEWWALERRGLGGKGEVRMARMLLEEGNRIGTVVEDGLRVSLSIRQAAEKLSCRTSTVTAVRDRLVESGLLRVDRSECGKRTASGLGSAAFVLVARDDSVTPPPISFFPGRSGGGCHAPVAHQRGDAGNRALPPLGAGRVQPRR